MRASFSSSWRSPVSLLNAAVIVAALGYFVDAYDILLFSIVRVTSLKDLGLDGDALTQSGLFLINMQMGGMIIGSIMWGILGDKKGRITVLFGSILLYSIANIANAFVHSVNAYAVWRLIAGIGLAGELGAGVTLVMEQMPKEKRGLGAMIIGAVGVFGVVVAALVGDLVHWRNAYIIGGVMGLALLVLRATLCESKLFEKAQKDATIKRGDFLALFNDWARFKRYLSCVLIGVPIYFVIAILVTLAPELTAAWGMAEPIKTGQAIIYCYVGLTIGDLCAGLLSQKLHSRKKVVLIYLAALSVSITGFYLFGASSSLVALYAFYGLMGFFCGIFIFLPTIASELFGTNLRATAASTVPNFVRGATVPLNIGLAHLKYLGIITASQIVGAVVLLLAFAAAFSLRETFSDDLDFEEDVK